MPAGDRDTRRPRATVHRDRAEFDALSIAAAITTRGKELAIDDTVEDARRLFARHPVRVLPVLRGTTYVGALTEEAVGGDLPGNVAVAQLAVDDLPVVRRDLPAPEALAILDDTGGGRLVVVESDGRAYVGLVCMRRDRRRLCVSASGAESASDGGA